MATFCANDPTHPEKLRWGAEQGIAYEMRDKFREGFDYSISYPLEPTAWLPPHWRWCQLPGEGGRWRRCHVDHHGVLHTADGIVVGVLDASVGIVRSVVDTAVNVTKGVVKGGTDVVRDVTGYPKSNEKVVFVVNNSNKGFKKQSKKVVVLKDKKPHRGGSDDDGSSSDSDGSSSSSSDEGDKKSDAKVEEVKTKLAEFNISQQDIDDEAQLLHAIGEKLRVNSMEPSSAVLLSGDSEAKAAGFPVSEVHSMKCSKADCDYCGGHGGAKPMRTETGKTAWEIIEASGEHTILAGALRRMDSILALIQSDNQFTVFAPNDKAFARLGFMKASDLPSSSTRTSYEKFRDVLKNHFVKNLLDADALKYMGDHDQTLKSINRNVWKVRVLESGFIKIGDATVVKPFDQVTRNGSIVHTIDRVLVAEEPSPSRRGIPANEKETIDADVDANESLYAKWQENELAGLKFKCENAAASAAAAAAPASGGFGMLTVEADDDDQIGTRLLLSPEEANKMASEFAASSFKDDAALKAKIKDAVHNGTPLSVSFNHRYVGNLTGLQIKGQIVPEHVQNINVTLNGKKQTLESGKQAYYFDLGVAPVHPKKGVSEAKRGVARNALKIEFDKTARQYTTKLITSQLKALSEKNVHERAIAQTQLHIDRLISGALNSAN
jgi:uncharacterized surface protein with fasciclin (FAS1) repeats